ncbi:MAG: DUF1987 domain-containing protein [Bacteroidales bacterium]|nr:DUF1987 domain-containing protein [Bacteroidales bacterium]
METIKILSNIDSPAVYLNPKKERFEIRGRSLPENAKRFYDPIIEWLDNYSKSPNKKTEFIFHLDFLNTTTTKLFVTILKKLELAALKSDVNILWYYDTNDEDHKEIGNDLKETVNIPFELVPVSGDI